MYKMLEGEQWLLMLNRAWFDHFPILGIASHGLREIAGDVTRIAVVLPC